MTGLVRRWLGRVPLRQQLTTTECGAACLAMVLAYHGRDGRVSEYRERIGLGRDGASVDALARAAGQYGLVATIERVADPPDGGLGEPAVAYMADHHFVVVEKVTRRGVRVADPAAGRYWATREEFRARYGGVLLRLRPGAGFRRARVPWRDRVLVRYLRQFVAARGGRRLLAGIVGLAAAIQLVGLAMPLATKVAVDTLIPHQRMDLLGVFVTAVLGTAVLHGALALLRQWLLLVLRVRADALLTQRFVAHLLRLPLTFFVQRARGDLLMRLGSVSTTRESLTQQALTLLLDTALLSSYAIGLAVFSPGYLAVAGVLGAAQLVPAISMYGRLRQLAQRELIAKAEEQNYLVETLEAIVPVKANGVESQVEANWRVRFDAYQRALRRRSALYAWLEGGLSGLSTMAPLALLSFGMWMVLRGDMTLGAMLAANTLAGAVLGPIQYMVGANQMFSVLRAQIDRIYDVLDASPEPAGPRTPAADGAPVAVTTRNLSFSYSPQGRPVLSGVDLDIPAGSKVGIVGRTGSGKTTLALLILGLLRATHGSVRHDGIPLEDWDTAALRRGFGAVLQDLALFNGTIHANLTLARPDATDDEVHRAAKIAGLHDDIMALPMGYQTIVGEGGAALSAGQRQRVALARAVIHRPRLLVLDEATSHLDPVTERRVDDALCRLAVTRVVISHRLSAIRNADEILVIDQGRIVARGRHEDLVEKGGIYRELFGPQGAEPTGDPVPWAAGTPRRREVLNA